MRKIIKKQMSNFTNGIEIFLAALLILGILITIFDLFYKIGDLAQLVFFNGGSDSIRSSYDLFFELAIQLVIGIEFTKMLVQHTQDNMIEILLLLVARKIVVSHNGTYDLLIGVFSIALLFVVKRFFISESRRDSAALGVVLSGGTTVSEANGIVNSIIPEIYGATLREFMQNKLAEAGRHIAANQKIVVGKHTLKISSVKQGVIDEVEIYRNGEE